jgi:DMSO/TMAO reductase YedYZ molybdopterin-dependent catalytic subunit
MRPKIMINRRSLMTGLAAGGLLPLAGCSLDSRSPGVMSILDKAEYLTEGVQRALLAPRLALAPEFSPGMITPTFKPNGSIDPDDPDYVALRQNGFADWKLAVGGLVERPMSLSLADLRALPSRSQITRHDCVEGWSAIGKWTGVPLGHVLKLAQLSPETRFIVLYCADELERNDGGYYESMDMHDAFHPQTLLAYGLNDKPLPVANGAPLRLRIERQLGYKHAKYLMRIEAVARLDDIHGGKGGYWEDRGYEWYAGI